MKEPDPTQTAAFLEAISSCNGWHTPFTWQVFPDHGGSPVRPHHFTASLTDAYDALVRADVDGGGVFVTMQETNGNGRTAADIVAGRVLFIDWDEPTFDLRFALPPTLTQWSGRGMHAIWRIVDLPLSEIPAAQKRLATFYGSDASVVDLPRVLRVPGFYHQKSAPILVTIAHVDLAARYSLSEVIAAHPVPEEPPVVREAPVFDSTDKAISAYRNWCAKKEANEGERHRNAFLIAVKGAQTGIPTPVIEGEVDRFIARCTRSFPRHERDTIIRDALKGAGR